ncbi:hypothetical protein D3C73_1590150 [compost metagenome]
MAVTVPAGTSSGVKATRTKRSAPTSIIAPRSIEVTIPAKRARPTSNRARCGAISPKNPTPPTKATAIDVSSAATKNTAMR